MPLGQEKQNIKRPEAELAIGRFGTVNFKISDWLFARPRPPSKAGIYVAKRRQPRHVSQSDEPAWNVNR